MKGKKYASLYVLERLHPVGFAVVQEGGWFDPGPTCWWHRAEGRARERVRRLRARGKSVYFLRLGAVTVTSHT